MHMINNFKHHHYLIIFSYYFLSYFNILLAYFIIFGIKVLFQHFMELFIIHYSKAHEDFKKYLNLYFKINLHL